jgi:hypothetical protein
VLNTLGLTNEDGELKNEKLHILQNTYSSAKFTKVTMKIQSREIGGTCNTNMEMMNAFNL